MNDNIEQEQERLREKENELLSTYFMGDIREDVIFLGLNYKDMIWIVGNSLLGSVFLFIFPFSYWVKIPGILLIVGLSLISRMLAWPYRRRRRLHYMRQKKQGVDLQPVHNIEEESWYYRNGKTIHVALGLSADPWETAVYNQKSNRIQGFEAFLRAMAAEGFSARLSAEMVPDYQTELWKQKSEQPTESFGLKTLKQNRIDLWKRQADKETAKRSVYILTLTIKEFRIDIRERDDEPEELDKNELKRFRMLAELREKLKRVLDPLAEAGHASTILSGYAVPEIMSRWWDPQAWKMWVSTEGDWSDSEEGSTVDQLEHMAEEERQIQESVTEEFSEVAASSEELPVKSKRMFILRLLGAAGRTILFLLQRVANGFVFASKACTRQLRRLKRNKKAKEPINDPLPEQDGTDQESKVSTNHIPPVQGITYLTSPAATGKSFLAANMAVTMNQVKAQEQKSMVVVDLSPDRGVLSYLNPLQVKSPVEGWELWITRNAPGLELWLPIPKRILHLEELAQRLAELKKRGTVIVDLPFHYPGREALFRLGTAIAIVDDDYHHWLQWVQAAEEWSGEVWLNQMKETMQAPLSAVVKEQWDKSVTYSIPFFSDASRWLFNGRPYALHPEAAQLLRQEREDASDAERDEKAN
ncbi:hypothetical protein ABEW34_21570 [Paenibacillus algorifonticola]|uniref:hypothetical protein n=1 Tax=Paenibacillus algorifonticola TaxID=684063 RepID=UPI003D2DF5E7